jgi:hypothetical protein
MPSVILSLGAIKFAPPNTALGTIVKPTAEAAVIPTNFRRVNWELDPVLFSFLRWSLTRHPF